MDDSQLEQEARNPTTLPRRLKRLATHPSKQVRRSTAQNPNTPQSVLKQLAVDSFMDTRGAVARNPSALPSTQLKLSKDPQPWVKAQLSSHPSAHHDALRNLADEYLPNPQGWGGHILAFLASNPNTPTASLVGIYRLSGTHAAIVSKHPQFVEVVRELLVLSGEYEKEAVRDMPDEWLMKVWELHRTQI